MISVYSATKHILMDEILERVLRLLRIKFILFHCNKRRLNWGNTI